jgi:hypothetical protein
MSTRHRDRRSTRAPGASRDARGPAPGAPLSRTPLLLRVTLVTAVLMAVATSLVRSHAGSIAADQAFTPASAAAIGPASSSAAPAPRTAKPRPSAAGASCRVRSAVTSRSGDSYTTVLTITNTGSARVAGWTLRWPTPPGQQITNGWNATVTTDARGARASDAGLNRDLPVGGSTTIGFIAMSGTPASPTTFTLNGVRCR